MKIISINRFKAQTLVSKYSYSHSKRMVSLSVALFKVPMARFASRRCLSYDIISWKSFITAFTRAVRYNLCRNLEWLLRHSVLVVGLDRERGTP